MTSIQVFKNAALRVVNYSDMISICVIGLNYYESKHMDAGGYLDEALEYLSADPDQADVIIERADWKPDFHLKVFKSVVRKTETLSDLMDLFRLTIYHKNIKDMITNVQVKFGPVDRCEVCGHEADEADFEREHLKKTWYLWAYVS